MYINDTCVIRICYTYTHIMQLDTCVPQSPHMSPPIVKRTNHALFLPFSSDGGMAKRPPGPLREPCREVARNAQLMAMGTRGCI